VTDLLRRHGVSRAVVLPLAAQVTGVSAPDVKQLRQLDEENAKLKRMYADLRRPSSSPGPRSHRVRRRCSFSHASPRAGSGGNVTWALLASRSQNLLGKTARSDEWAAKSMFPIKKRRSQGGSV
jgi:hypothetical protein